MALGSQGRVCRSRDIRGERLRDIPGELRGCGVNNPVRVSSVSGVALNPPAVMDCDTAKALNEWVDEGVKPTIGRLGGGIAELRVVDDYSCRPRNNRPGAEISEHGRGKAIDIASFNLRNGVRIPVEGGWNDRVQGRLLKQMHREACGPFGTVLGPDADRYHQDHFHLDTARHGNGNYCR
ncbi:MAG: extensin family protein [Rhodobacteraceae bacterium]|nr:extensin family protein [Paracoccaceae bacterium]